MSKRLDLPLAHAAEDRFLCIEKVARRYDCSERHIRRLVDVGTFPTPQRFGRLLRWNIDQLASWENSGCPAIRKISDSKSKGRQNG